MKIGFTGTMSVGKTTLVNALKELPEFKDYNFKTERSKYLRDLGIPLNTDSTTKGQIIFFEGEGDCAYAIKTIGEGFEYLDPLNLDEKYKIDGQQIWFKYRGLRRENRCENARPVEIIEIMIREK